MSPYIQYPPDCTKNGTNYFFHLPFHILVVVSLLPQETGRKIYVLFSKIIKIIIGTQKGNSQRFVQQQILPRKIDILRLLHGLFLCSKMQREPNTNINIKNEN